MDQVGTETSIVDARHKSTREVNAEIKRLVVEGTTNVLVRNPAARHSLGVALRAEGVRVEFDGPVGWYCAGMNWGPEVLVRGNAGWAIGECMMDGRIEVEGHAGSGAAASIRGGLVVVRGDGGARAGIAMKGGTLVVGGSVGYMSGFMMQQGTMIVCGDAAEGIGDSMYEGTIFVGGSIASLGADAVEHEVTDQDRERLSHVLEEVGLETSVDAFRKILAGRKLWNFSTREPELWKVAL